MNLASSPTRYGTFDAAASSSTTSMNINTDDQANNAPGATPAASSSKDKGGYRPANKAATVWSWFTSQDLYLNNVGSVARDHLAVSLRCRSQRSQHNLTYVNLAERGTELNWTSLKMMHKLILNTENLPCLAANLLISGIHRCR